MISEAQRRWYEENKERLNEQRRKRLGQKKRNTKPYRHLYAIDKKEYHRLYDEEYSLSHSSDEEFLRRRRERAREYCKNLRQKKYQESENRARDKVYHAIRAGKLVKQPCEVCGSELVEAHHDDYNYPLQVRWLCKKHHTDWHATHEPTRCSD